MSKICKNCKPDCLQETPGGCLPYTSSESIDCVGIQSALTEDSDIQENLIKVGKAFCQFLDDNTVDLSCLQGDLESPLQQSYVAVNKLLDFVCNLNTDNIGTGANLYCLSDGISLSASKLTNKSFTWSTQSLSDGVNFTYNLLETVESLPQDFVLNSVSIKANGKRVGSSKTLLASTTETVGGFKLQPDNYPVNVTAEIKIGTPDGELILEKRLSLTGNYNSDTYRSNLDIRDFSNNTNFSLTSQTQFNEILASAYCHIKQLYDNLKNISISDCEYIQYPDGHINSVLQVHSTKLCEALDRITNIGAEKINYQDCDDNCGTTIREITVQEAFDLSGRDICSLLERVKNLESRVTELELQIQNCCT